MSGVRQFMRRMENETPLSVDELVEMLKKFVRECPAGEPRKTVFNAMLNSDPFSCSADEIIKRKEEILNEN